VLFKDSPGPGVFQEAW